MKKFISLLLTAILFVTTCFASFVPFSGDVNGDSEITVIDVAKTRAFIIGNLQFTEGEIECGNINKDAGIDIVDVVMMRFAIVNNNGNLYVPENETDTEDLTETDIQTDTESETDTQVETEVDTDTNRETEIDTENQTDSEEDLTEVETETESDVQTDTEEVKDTDTETEVDTQTDTDIRETEIDTDFGTVDTEKEPFERLYYYRNLLSGHLLTNYDRIVEGIENHAEDVVLETMTEEELFDIYTYVTLDHPEYYYLATDYFYGVNDDDEVVMIMIEYKDEFNTAEEVAEGFKYIDSRLDPIIAEANKKKTDFEKVLYAYDAVSSLFSYVAVPEGHDIYGSLTTGNAVCEGYSETFQYMLTKMEITSILVNGIITSDGVRHRWNMLLLDGKWYHFDVTWDDCKGGIKLPYGYFGVTTEEILRSRTIEYVAPIATATDYNYFTRLKMTTSSNDFEELKVCANNSVAITGDCIAIKFDSKADFDTFVANITVEGVKLIRVFVPNKGFPWMPALYNDMYIVQMKWLVT